MKYLDLCALHEVSRALNFNTGDTEIIGSCDAWTTKAAGEDKKLYKRIEATLQDKHAKMVAQLRDMSPQVRAQFEDQFDLSRATPFGSFHDPTNRHKFAYLISTLNGTHEHYDFANAMEPFEFHPLTMEQFKQQIDTTLYNFRPFPPTAESPNGAMTPLGSPVWCAQTWRLLDSEMGLNDCEYYAWKPSNRESDPHAEDALWGCHYLLYNKERKRVCYFEFRVVSAMAMNRHYPMSMMSKYKQSQNAIDEQKGSSKRKDYWFGSSSSSRHSRRHKEYGSNDDLDGDVIDHPGEVVDADEVLSFREASDYESWDDDEDIDAFRPKMAVD